MIVAFVVFLGVFVTSTPPLMAQAGVNEHGCEWDYTGVECTGDESECCIPLRIDANNCLDGFMPDARSCAAIDDPVVCSSPSTVFRCIGDDSGGTTQTGVICNPTGCRQVANINDPNIPAEFPRFVYPSDEYPTYSDAYLACLNEPVSQYCDPGTENQTGNYSCGWGLLNNPDSPYHGRPAFCIGGFADESIPADFQLNFGCEVKDGIFDCGGPITYILSGQRGQTVRISEVVNYPNFEWGADPNGGYYTCFTGYWDRELIEIVSSVEDYYGMSCGGFGAVVGLVTAGATSFIGGPAGVVMSVAVGATAGTNAYQECIRQINEDPLTLNIYGAFLDSQGGQLCRSPYSVTYDFVLQYESPYLCDAGGASMGIDTAIGCIPIDFVGRTVGFFLQWAIGIGGGVVFMLVVLGAAMILTSAGRPERMKAGRELIVSAIAGMLLIVFSVFLMNVLGVNVLQLPGFGG